MCHSTDVLECVVNISEGRNLGILSTLAEACGEDLLDVHIDGDHNRSVFTLLGISAPRRLSQCAVELLHLENHQGVHPRLGVVDVVPFVPLVDSTMFEATQARDEFAEWAVTTLGVPCFLYGTEKSLPDIRRQAWSSLMPDRGGPDGHSTAGAMCVGARGLLVAYNVWMSGDTSAEAAHALARQVRGDGIRTLALNVGDRWQISMNLIDPLRIGPDIAFDRIAQLVPFMQANIDHCELVGLLSEATLKKISCERWDELGLGIETTIEYRRSHGYHF